MSYKMLAVVVSDVDVQSEYTVERRKFSNSPEQLRWLVEQEAEEVVMESTARVANVLGFQAAGA